MEVLEKLGAPFQNTDMRLAPISDKMSIADHVGV